MIEIDLTEDQQSELESQFGDHEELNKGNYYVIPAQIYTQEDGWVIRTEKFSGGQASAFNEMASAIFRDNVEPLTFRYAKRIVKKIVRLQDMLEEE